MFLQHLKGDVDGDFSERKKRCPGCPATHFGHPGQPRPLRDLEKMPIEIDDV